LYPSIPLVECVRHSIGSRQKRAIFESVNMPYLTVTAAVPSQLAAQCRTIAQILQVRAKIRTRADIQVCSLEKTHLTLESV
jgi:hypothetical protein